ncbi:helix-turn-helix transcriptional regulator [Frondihabitans cladoniiphilus]|uniref:HTH cro/C1-type domain-containing protein n=1 Tax=Frondihabitans cladoniiphilus TaxID=715785 RepID=A0ABP8VTM5_9MICO
MTQTNWFRSRTPASLGSAIKELREAAGETQAQFARAIGSSRATVSRLERGESVTSDVLFHALARVRHEFAVIPRGSRLRVEAADAPN